MITGQIHSAAAHAQLMIHAGGSNHEVLVFGLSPIAYKHDLTPDQVDIESLMVLHQTMNVDLDRYDSAGADLYKVLRATETCKVELKVDTFERQTFTFLFRYNRSDMSLKAKGTEINLKLSVWFRENVTCGEVFDAIADKKFFRRQATATLTGSSFNPGSFNYNAVGVGEWISKAMQLIFEYNSSVVRSAETGMGEQYTEHLFDALPSPGQAGFVMVDMPDLFFAPTAEGKSIITGSGTVSWSIEATDFQNGVSVYILRLTGFGTQFMSEIAIGDEIEAAAYLGQVTNRESDTVVYTLIEQSLYTEFRIIPRPFFIARAPRPRMIPALDVLKKLAGVEGSIFGHAFNQNFYINRLRRDPNQRVAVAWEEVADCRPLHINKPLSESFVSTIVDGQQVGTDQFGSWPAPTSTLNRRIPNLRPYKSIIRGNNNGSKSLKISLPAGYPFMCKGVRVGDIIDAQAGNAFLDNDTTLESALTQAGIKSHHKAISITDDELLIEFEFNTAFLVKPWQTFYFQGAPEEFSGKEFRVTEIEYDLYGNGCRGKAYQVDTVASQVIPEKISNLGLDFQFGNKIIPEGLLAPINDILSDGLRLIATFVTSQPTSGLITEVHIIRADGDTTSIPMGYKITLVNPSLISQKVELELLEDLPSDGTTIQVVPVQFQGTFPAGSFVYISNRSIMSGILTGEFGVNLFSKTFGIGVLTAAINGTVTELPVDLWSSVRTGRSLFLIDILRNVSVNIQTASDAGSGPGTMFIEEQLINMPAGALVYLDGAQLQALIQMDPGHIHLSVERERKANAIGELVDGISSSFEITQLDVLGTKPGQVIGNGTPLRVTNPDGSGDTFVTSAEVSITSIYTPIPIHAQTPEVELYAGATVHEPAGSVSSRITVASNQISLLSTSVSGNTTAIAGLTTRVTAAEATVVMKASVTSGKITKLALVALNASVASGSSIDLNADNVNVTGQGNFFSALYNEGVASQTYADGVAVTRRDQARNNIAAQLGYADYAAMVSEAVAGKTVINGGMINTVLLNVSWIFAQSASITNTLTMGSVGKIRHNDDKWIIDNSGIFLGAGQGTYDQSTAIRIGNRLRIYGVDGSPDVDGAYFEMAQPGQFMKFISRSDVQFDLDSGRTITMNAPLTVNAPFAANSVFFGTQANKAVLFYNTNVTRVLTIPSLSADSTFAFLEQNQVFTGTVSVPNATAGAHALNRSTADGRYAQLGGTNTWSSSQTFQGGLVLQATAGGLATLVYSPSATNNRTFTLPRTASGDVIAVLREPQIFTGQKTFTSNLIIPNASAGDHALNRSTADGRYVRPGQNNTFTVGQSFTGNLNVYGPLRVWEPGANGYAQLSYYGTVNRTIIIPTPSSNGLTLAMIDEAQTFTAQQTFAYNNLRLRNNAGTNNANLRWNGNANVTFNLPPDGGQFVTAEQFSNGTSLTPGHFLQLIVNGWRYTWAVHRQAV